MTRETSLLLAIALLLAVLAAAAPGFFTGANIRDLLVANAPTLLVALGMTIIIVAGHIDVSVGAQFAVVSVITGLLARDGLPLWLLALVVPLAGAALGALNGVLVSFAGLPSIVVTLATMVILRESLRWATDGAWVQGLPADFQWFGLGQVAGQTMLLVVVAILTTALAWSLRHLAAGRAVYATGSDREAARLVGIPTRAVVAGAFVLAGALTSLAALLNAIRFAEVPANAGLGLEMRAIAAAVVGGASVTGGRGSARGTLLGVVLLGLAAPALTFLGVSAHWERAIQGGILIGAVTLDALGRRRARHVAVAVGHA